MSPIWTNQKLQHVIPMCKKVYFWGLTIEFMVNDDDDVIIFSTIAKAFTIQPSFHMVTKIIITNYVDTFFEYLHIISL
jgi:hypothetical protein